MAIWYRKPNASVVGGKWRPMLSSPPEAFGRAHKWEGHVSRGAPLQRLMVFALGLAISMNFCGVALAQQNEIENFIASIQSVEQAKRLMGSALTADCGTGSCADNNATLVCSVIAALDLRVKGQIAGLGSPALKQEVAISPQDLNVMRRVWSGCKPTVDGFWRHGALLHVAYSAESTEVQQVVSMLKEHETSTPKAPSASPRRSDQSDSALAVCVTRYSNNPNYSYSDGGRSARNLLEGACRTSYIEWVDACINGGDSRQSCVTKAAVIAQVAIGMSVK